MVQIPGSQSHLIVPHWKIVSLNADWYQIALPEQRPLWHDRGNPLVFPRAHEGYVFAAEESQLDHSPVF